MNVTGRPISIKRWLGMIILGIGSTLLIVQLLFLRFFTGYVENIYRSNINGVMEQIAAEVQETFSTMTNTVSYMAASGSVQQYTQTADTQQRYKLAYGEVRPVVFSLTENLGFNHFLIFDATGSWYDFFTPISTSYGRMLSDAYYENQKVSLTEVTNTTLTLGNEPYFCSFKPVLTLTEGKVRQTGMVLALIDMNKTRKMLKDYSEHQRISIRLHNFSKVLVSNIQELEGGSITGSTETDSEILSLDATILAGSLGVTVSISQGDIFPQRTTLVFILLAVGIFSLLLLGFLALFTNRLIVQPVTQVIGETRRLGDSSLKGRLNDTGVAQVDALVASINDMLSRLEDYSRRIVVTQQNLYEMELDQRETQLYLLRNQIDRHFLYNSLISIRTLADRRESAQIKEVAGGIAQLLRYTTSKVQEVNLFDEMEIVQRYVNIQNIRFRNSITWDLNVDDRLCEYKILKLLIQPLVENALIHGLESAPHMNRVLSLRGELLTDCIRIQVEDNGLGIPAQRLIRIQKNIEEMENLDSSGDIDGIALVNIQKRMNLAYGKGYGLTIESRENQYTRATLILPLRAV